MRFVLHDSAEAGLEGFDPAAAGGMLDPTWFGDGGVEDILPRPTLR
jgi:hypothetical protein